MTASTRDALLLTMAAIAQIPEYRPRLVGVCICGAVPVSPVTQRIIDASGIPYLRTNLSSTEVSSHLSEFVAKLSSDDTLKLDWLFDAGLQEVGDESLAALFSTGATA